MITISSCPNIKRNKFGRFRQCLPHVEHQIVFGGVGRRRVGGAGKPHRKKSAQNCVDFPGRQPHPGPEGQIGRVQQEMHRIIRSETGANRQSARRKLRQRPPDPEVLRLHDALGRGRKPSGTAPDGRAPEPRAQRHEKGRGHEDFLRVQGQERVQPRRNGVSAVQVLLGGVPAPDRS